MYKTNHTNTKSINKKHKIFTLEKQRKIFQFKTEDEDIDIILEKEIKG